MISSSSPLMKSIIPIGRFAPLTNRLERRSDARKIRRFVGASRSIPLRHLAEWTERPRAVGGPVRHVPRLDALRRGAGLDPLFHRAHAIEIVGARTALAMIHAGHHVELNRRADTGTALRGDDLLE